MDSAQRCWNCLFVRQNVWLVLLFVDIGWYPALNLSNATLPKIPLVQFSTKASTQTQCSSGVLLKHFTCVHHLVYPSHILLSVKETWYWTLRVHFLKSFSILLSFSCPHLRTGRWPPVPRRRERTALLVISPATSPTNFATSDPSAVGWRWTMKWPPSFVVGHSLEICFLTKVNANFGIQK